MIKFYIITGYFLLGSVLNFFAIYADQPPIRINEIQLKASHNSYHILRTYHPYRYLPQQLEEWGLPWDYEHGSLSTQLENYGVRGLELDIHYAHGEFRVYHIYGLDDASSCPNLDECLADIRAWSDAHPEHHMIFLYVESKDRDDPKDRLLNRFVADHFAELEQNIVDILGRDKLYTPSDLKGDFNSMHERIETIGWPTVDETRGKILLVYLKKAIDRDLYLKYGDNKATNLLMFMNASTKEATGDRAKELDIIFTGITNPIAGKQTIESLVKKGFIVRTFAEDGGRRSPEALKGSTERLDAALASGAQVITTDVPASAGKQSYKVEIPDGTPSRCNPVTASDSCTPTAIENLPIED